MCHCHNRLNDPSLRKVLLLWGYCFTMCTGFYFPTNKVYFITSYFGMSWKDIWTSMKPVFANHLTTQHANGNKGNKTGLQTGPNHQIMDRTASGFAGWPANPLDNQHRTEIHSTDNLCCASLLFERCCITLDNADSISAKYRWTWIRWW